MEAALSSVGRAFKDATRHLKEQAHEYLSNETHLERQLREATANANWGTSKSLLNEIALATYDSRDYALVMSTVWACLAAPPTKWRRVLKTLVLLEHLIYHGPETVVDEVRSSTYRLKSISSTFIFTDGGKDRGLAVREKAAAVAALVADAELLQNERKLARQRRARLVGFGADNVPRGSGGQHSSAAEQRHTQAERERVDAARAAARERREQMLQKQQQLERPTTNRSERRFSLRDITQHKDRRRSESNSKRRLDRRDVHENTPEDEFFVCSNPWSDKQEETQSTGNLQSTVPPASTNPFAPSAFVNHPSFPPAPSGGCNVVGSSTGAKPFEALMAKNLQNFALRQTQHPTAYNENLLM